MSAEAVIKIQSILIYGMGMMGASLAHNLRKSKQFEGKIAGVVRTAASAGFIKQHQIADKILIQNSPEAIAEMDLSQYDLIILGIPPRSIVEMVPHIPPSAPLITDMSSTRREVHNAFAVRDNLRFIGSHPMCGSENRGPQAALPDLYHNRLCLILSDNRLNIANQQDYENLHAFWQALEMKTTSISCQDHDRVLAYLSHTPHILSSLLALWAAGSPPVRVATNHSNLPITGGGFKDMSRIAGSNPEMWTDVIETNRDNMQASLLEFRDQLDTLIDDFETRSRQDWIQWLTEARKARDFLCE